MTIVVSALFIGGYCLVTLTVWQAPVVGWASVTEVRVPARLIDEGIRYRMDLLKSRMKLEPAADRHLGFGSWSVLYPKGKSGE